MRNIKLLIVAVFFNTALHSQTQSIIMGTPPGGTAASTITQDAGSIGIGTTIASQWPGNLVVPGLNPLNDEKFSTSIVVAPADNTQMGGSVVWTGRVDNGGALGSLHDNANNNFLNDFFITGPSIAPLGNYYMGLQTSIGLQVNPDYICIITGQPQAGNPNGIGAQGSFEFKYNLIVDGNEGINTTNPEQRLELHNGAALFSDPIASDGGILFKNNATLPAVLGDWGIQYNESGIGRNDNGMNFWKPAGSANPGVNILFLDDNHNIGISNGEPTDNLDINGTTRVRTLPAPNLAAGIIVNGTGSLGQTNQLQSLAFLPGSPTDVLYANGNWGPSLSLGCATTDFVPKVTGANSMGCSQIFDNTRNVIINGTDPRYTLIHVPSLLYNTPNLMPTDPRLIVDMGSNISDASPAGLMIKGGPSQINSPTLGFSLVDDDNENVLGANIIGGIVSDDNGREAMDLIFTTKDNTNTWTPIWEKMRISHNGYVGINTAHPVGLPTAMFHVDVTSQTPTTGIRFEGLPTAIYPYVVVADADGHLAKQAGTGTTAVNGVSLNTGGSVVLGQDVCGTGTNPAELSSNRYIPLNNKFVFFSDGPNVPGGALGEGRVGIGLTCGTNPAAKLDIYKPHVVDDVTPIGLQVINNDVATAPSSVTPFGSGYTAIGINASLSSTTNEFAIGGMFNSAGATKFSTGVLSQANTSGIGTLATSGLYFATAMSGGDACGLWAISTGSNSSVGVGLNVSGASSNSGVQAEVNCPLGSSSNYGGLFNVLGSGSLNYGGYFSASGGVGSTNYAGYFSGDVYCSGSYLPSDEKLKSNVQDFKNSLDIISRLNVKSYTYNIDEFKNTMILPEGKQIGIMAQNMQSVLPNLVKQTVAPSPRDAKTHKPTGEDTKFLAVNYVGLIPVLVQAMQELDVKTTENQALTQKVADMESKYAALQSQINDLCNNGCAGLKGTGTNTDPAVQPVNQLLQNVPNPFSRQTSISYVLNTGTTAYMNINGLDGKLIKHIALTINGAGKVTINSDEMASGTYTYSLYVDDKVIDTKLMVITAKD